MAMENVPYEKRLKVTESTKKWLRNSYHRWLEESECPQWHYDEDGESRWCKKFFVGHFTEEDKKDFIESNRKEINSQYDCTGLWFTRWIAIFNLGNGNSVTYICEGLDV